MGDRFTLVTDDAEWQTTCNMVAAKTSDAGRAWRVTGAGAVTGPDR